VINAMVPLANMFGYVNTLRSMSQGRAQYTMIFDHYEAGAAGCGPGIQKQIRLAGLGGRRQPKFALASGWNTEKKKWPRKSLNATSRT
jgi:hypothetical protein